MASAIIHMIVIDYPEMGVCWVMYLVNVGNK